MRIFDPVEYFFDYRGGVEFCDASHCRHSLFTDGANLAIQAARGVRRTGCRCIASKQNACRNMVPGDPSKCELKKTALSDKKY